MRPQGPLARDAAASLFFLFIYFFIRPNRSTKQTAVTLPRRHHARADAHGMPAEASTDGPIATHSPGTASPPPR